MISRRISFRPMQRQDFPLLRKWLAAPHVALWWNEPFDTASLEAKFGPRIDGREPIPTYMIEHEGRPIGWIQWYRWSDFPEHANLLGAEAGSAGIDLAIGELEMTGRGIGPAVIEAFGMGYVFSNSDVGAIVADPAAANVQSVRAFEEAGFSIVGSVRLRNEEFERCVVRAARTRSPLC